MSETIASPVVELHFPLRAQSLPSDHAYSLYSAISKILPEVHGASWLGIHSVKGRKVSAGKITIGRFAKLRIRIPLDRTPLLYKLAGASLDLKGHQVKLGIPELKMLEASDTLRARICMVKIAGSKGKSAEPKSFVSALEKQLAELGVQGRLELEREINRPDKDEFARRVIRIKDKILTGYTVVLRGLSDSDSLKVQEHGLGGRRKMGCGLFDPIQSGDD